MNIQNFHDDKCLVWYLIAHKHSISREHKPEGVSHYVPYEEEVKLEKLTTLVH